MSTALAIRLSEDQARSLTDEVKDDAQKLWAKCLELYEGEAHLALGYTSWGAYWKAEFGQSGASGYRLLESARVAKSLILTCENGPENARQAAELARVPEEQRAEVWARVRESGDVTARAIKTVAAEVVYDPKKGGAVEGDIEYEEEACGEYVPGPPDPGDLAGVILQMKTLRDNMEMYTGMEEMAKTLSSWLKRLEKELESED